MDDDDDIPGLGDLLAAGFTMPTIGREARPGTFGLGSVGAVPIQRLPPIQQKSEMMNAYRGLWEMVPVDWLSQLRGNNLRNPLDELRASIQSEGVSSPLIINAGKNSRTAQLGEGNHRLAAIRSMGYTHAPARVIVGSEWGRGGPSMDTDLIPEPDTYFRADAPPSAVFRSLRR
jgi:hypothetical protein